MRAGVFRAPHQPLSIEIIEDARALARQLIAFSAR